MHKNKLLFLDEGATDDINDSVGIAEKKFSITFSKAKAKFWLSLHYNGDNSYLLVTGIEIYKFKVNQENVNFSTIFFLGSISEKCSAVESRKVSFKGNMFDYSVSVDSNAIDKSEILNIHKYLLVENNVK